MLKVNNRNTRTRCEICSGIFIVNFEHISVVSFEHVITGWDKVLLVSKGYLLVRYI